MFIFVYIACAYLISADVTHNYTENNHIFSLHLSASELCGPTGAGADSLPPRFFRVSDQDLSDFPPDTLRGGLNLGDVGVASPRAVSVSWSVTAAFYHSAYDWAIIFREIGDRRDNLSMFYKTRHTLDRHIREDPGWFPRNETLRAGLEGLAPDTYYEVVHRREDNGINWIISSS